MNNLKIEIQKKSSHKTCWLQIKFPMPAPGALLIYCSVFNSSKVFVFVTGYPYDPWGQVEVSF